MFSTSVLCMPHVTMSANHRRLSLFEAMQRGPPPPGYIKDLQIVHGTPSLAGFLLEPLYPCIPHLHRNRLTRRHNEPTLCLLFPLRLRNSLHDCAFHADRRQRYYKRRRNPRPREARYTGWKGGFSFVATTEQ
jgi:hypothetical protein